jgi:hypothetical protein
MQVLITGSPRAGTTMLTLMMHCFSNCDVYSNYERHPLHSNKFNETQNEYIIYKHPYGYFEEFFPYYDYQMLIDKGFKIISIIRNSRDVLVSRHQSDLSKYWVPVNIWKRVAKEVIKHKDDDDICNIKYEELVVLPYNTIDKISHYLECPYDNSFEDFFKLDNAELDKNKSLGKRREIDISSINNWAKDEHKEYIEELKKDTELVELDNELGYTYDETHVSWKGF